MKTLTLITIVALSLSTSAQSLEKNMKTMGKSLKAISKQIEDSGKNSDSISKVDDFISAAQKAKDQTPETIEKLPKDKQAEALSKYKDQTQKLIDKAQEFKKALEQKDNAKAKSIMGEMDQIRKDGHKEFKKKKKD